VRAARFAWVRIGIIRRKRRSTRHRGRILDGSHAGTNRQFRKFVNATGYVHFREITPDAKDYPGALPHMLKAGSLVFTPPKRAVDLRTGGNGGRSNSAPTGAVLWSAQQHQRARRRPGRHVAYRDVEAYAKWAGKELPTEAEWEFAARGGLDGAEFAWGDEQFSRRQAYGEHLAG